MEHINREEIFNIKLMDFKEYLKNVIYKDSLKPGHYSILFTDSKTRIKKSEEQSSAEISNLLGKIDAEDFATWTDFMMLLRKLTKSQYCAMDNPKDVNAFKKELKEIMDQTKRMPDMIGAAFRNYLVPIFSLDIGNKLLPWVNEEDPADSAEQIIGEVKNRLDFDVFPF